MFVGATVSMPKETHGLANVTLMISSETFFFAPKLTDLKGFSV